MAALVRVDGERTPPKRSAVIAPLPDAGGSRRSPVSTRARRLATVSISHGSTFLVASEYADIHSARGFQGLFTEDTRFLSHHEIRINGRALNCIASSQLSFRHARWMLIAPQMTAADGGQSGSRVTVTLDRAVGDKRMHEDILVRCYGREPVSVLLTVSLQSDFADVFEVRTQRWQRRTRLSTVWRPPNRLDTRYNRYGFLRRCLVRVSGRTRGATYANGALQFPVDVAPGQDWKVCLQYDLITSARARPALAPCAIEAPVEDRAERVRHRWLRTVARANGADLRLLEAFDQALEDFAALRLYDHDFSADVWLPAAGIPWFVAVFGRDPIIASLQALPVHSLFAIGTLQKLAQLQSDVFDPQRDAEPGKICHEIRVGEWAHFRTIPHTPYYGSADATPLYLMLLGEAYRWLGDSHLLHRFRNSAERCLEWIDLHGDRDHDGFQEYGTRSPDGYRNQCWRDSEDGVLDEVGNLPPLPLGTCEMQGYVYAAKLAVAPLFDAWGDGERAEELRQQARRLRGRFLETFWVADKRVLAFALDGRKQAVETATSNSGHCLWTGILDSWRGDLVADRLMQEDLFCGWGLRTLSSEHPAYDPHSYQRGSVWPHDTIIAAAGMRRYGRIEDCWRLVDGILAAAASFERTQLPEVFGGLARRPPDVPAPYERANVPQAWAAGAVFHAMRILLGLEPDVPAGRLYVDPALPRWCPELSLANVRIGGQRVTIRASRRRDGTSAADVSVSGGELEVIQGRAPWLSVD